MFKSCFLFEGDGLAITSLCPALGNKHSVIRHGFCPSDLQQPHQKKIRISVIGPAPYVISNKEKQWIGGAEFEIMAIFAKKFGFTPKLVYTRGFDNDGGLVDTVTFYINSSYISKLSSIFLNRLTGRIVKLG